MLRDLDQFSDLQRKVIDRLLTGPIRVVADRTAAIATRLVAAWAHLYRSAIAAASVA